MNKVAVGDYLLLGPDLLGTYCSKGTIAKVTGFRGTSITADVVNCDLFRVSSKL